MEAVLLPNLYIDLDELHGVKKNIAEFSSRLRKVRDLDYITMNVSGYQSNIDGTNKMDLTPFENIQARIIDDLEDDQNHVIIGLNKRNPQIHDPYRVNINDGTMKMIAENPGNISGWGTDHNGKLRIATTSDGVNTSLLYRDTESDKFKSILTTDFKVSVAPLFFTFDNKNLYASSSGWNGIEASNKISLGEYSLPP